MGDEGVGVFHLVQKVLVKGVECFHSEPWDSNDKSHGSHVGVPDKRSLKFFCTGTTIWRLPRHVQTLYMRAKLKCKGI